jgi:8-oxo-dGTP diphosphatase
MNGPLIDVLAAVIVREERYLICQRPLHKRHGGLWEFPGGKLEDGESWLEAAARELEEELALQVTSVEKPLLAIHDAGSPFNIVFVPVVTTGEPRPLEHDALEWVAANELLDLNLAPSDRRFAEWLVGRRGGARE